MRDEGFGALSREGSRSGICWRWALGLLEYEKDLHFVSIMLDAAVSRGKFKSRPGGCQCDSSLKTAADKTNMVRATPW